VLADWRLHAALAALLVAFAGLTAASSDGLSLPRLSFQDDEAPALPDPERSVPREPERLAGALADTTLALREAVAAWREEGDPARGQPPEDVTLLALYQQRIYLFLGTRPPLARRVAPLLPASVAAEARDILRARRVLGRLNPPTRQRRFRTGRALPAGRLLELYGEAERRFAVSRRVLAAVNLVETGFNRIRSNSTAGAQGPMQFIPSTWRSYGLGGRVRDPRDAIMGAGNYLHASGAPRDYRRALYAYNPSTLYVDAVLSYARAMRRRSDAYYSLYAWQVFVRRTDGVERITGPGL
jgi:soluble lytic murein transglycosylase-like protein